MYCKYCGREIDDNSSYCKYCGKPQDDRGSTTNGFIAFIDFVTNKPIVSAYILWAIINVVCLCTGDKIGNYYNSLYPRMYLDTVWFHYDYFDLDNYQITDFIVYTILIPLVLFLGYNYFKKVTSIKCRIIWALWFIFNILWYNWSDFSIDYKFFPFTERYGYPYFSYHAYDLSELVFYTMIIPIAYWGYLYYKDRNSAKSN